jgi:Ca-activated chloride channel family protein
MRNLLTCAVLLACASPTWAHGLLIPDDKTLPPLAMLNHNVSISINDQLATTRVEQTFRNHTDRNLEATYVFPVPKGATVNKFTMWIDGKETKGELLPAAEARNVYTSIVRRTQDPGLLEYIGNDMLQLKVFPIAPKSDQKVAVSFSFVAGKEGNLVEYVYPLKTDGKATATLEAFKVKATLTSQHGVGNVYSPTHAIAVKRKNEKEVEIEFEKNQALLDKDFQLFYSLSDADVGLTALMHKPVTADPGYMCLLVTPKMDRSKISQLGQDVVMVLDTSGSMRGVKMEQARKALKYCLNNLTPKDRFSIIQFATVVNRYRDELVEASSERVAHALKWVEDLDASGGTAIDAALKSAYELRPSNREEVTRPFTVVFFTDGQPTIGETNPEKITKDTLAASTRNTRVFTFGVGDDVNAVMLDRLAEGTRALSTYVRPAEDIEAKVSGMFAKMTNPVLTDLKLVTTGDVRLTEIYPNTLPDLFWGGQLVVFARYSGKGPTAIKLEGRVGADKKEFVYELTAADKTGNDKDFVEGLWARRKVGFLLDQIRVNGEKKELVDEVVTLAKRYGITTPYTSWLIVPDGVNPGVPRAANAPAVPPGELPRVNFAPSQPSLLLPTSGTSPINPASAAPVPPPLGDVITGKVPTPGPVGSGGPGFGGPGGFGSTGSGGGLADLRDRITTAELDRAASEEKKREAGKKGADKGPEAEALDRKLALDEVMKAIREKRKDDVTAGKTSVDLAVEMVRLRDQEQTSRTAVRQVQGRTCIELGGVWIDEGFSSKMKIVSVKAMSDGYFRLLEKQPKVKEVLQLGNFVVWVTPSGTALVIDGNHGAEQLKDEEIEALFKPGK